MIKKIEQNNKTEKLKEGWNTTKKTENYITRNANKQTRYKYQRANNNAKHTEITQLEKHRTGKEQQEKLQATVGKLSKEEKETK